MLPCKDKEKVPLALLALFYGPCIDSQLYKCNSLKQITLTFNAVRPVMLKEKKACYNEMFKDIWNKHFIKWHIYIITFLKQSNKVNITVGSLPIKFSSIHYDKRVIFPPAYFDEKPWVYFNMPQIHRMK